MKLLTKNNQLEEQTAVRLAIFLSFYFRENYIDSSVSFNENQSGEQVQSASLAPQFCCLPSSLEVYTAPGSLEKSVVC